MPRPHPLTRKKGIVKYDQFLGHAGKGISMFQLDCSICNYDIPMQRHTKWIMKTIKKIALRIKLKRLEQLQLNI